MILFLTILFARILIQTDIQDVMNNWDKRRCDVIVMFMAIFFKPSTDPRSATEFAASNFEFCVGENATNVIASAFAPLFDIFKQQLGTGSVIMNIMNNFRSYLKTAVESFSSILQDRLQQFYGLFDKFIFSFLKIKQGLSQVNAALIAMVYQAISGVKFFQNMIQFIIKVVIIIIAILAVLVIFLFLVMIPVIPLILTTISILVAAGLGGAVSSYGGAFCLHPSTQIVLSNNTTKSVSEICLGDELPPSFKNNKFPNSVTGILVAHGRDTRLLNVKGILMSETHRVMSQGRWKLAKDLPDSVPTKMRSDRLYILNTTHHWVPTINENMEFIYVSDWEEVDSFAGQIAWIQFVQKILGSNKLIYDVPDNIPLLGKDIQVYTPKGLVPIYTISIGDIVFNSKNRETVVIGLYKGRGPSNNDSWMSDGNWILDNGEWRIFLEGANGPLAQSVGYHLITESGDLRIQFNEVSYSIRDFTECGIENIEGCYSVLDDHL